MAGIYFGYTWLDKAAAIIIALLILKIALSTIWKTLAELIDTAPSKPVMNSIIECARSLEPQATPSKVRARTMAGKIYLDMRLAVNKHISASEGHYLGELVTSKIRQHNPNVSDILIHIDLEGFDQDEEIKKSIAKLPARNQILADLQFLLRSHKHYVDLTKVGLEYLDTGLEITLMAYAQSLNEQQTIERCCAAIEMDSMNIRYATINLHWNMQKPIPNRDPE